LIAPLGEILLIFRSHEWAVLTSPLKVVVRSNVSYWIKTFNRWVSSLWETVALEDLMWGNPRLNKLLWFIVKNLMAEF
jgi:hypothetical protein